MNAFGQGRPCGGQKRLRDDGEDVVESHLDHADKKARPTSGDSADSWHPRDSVISTPTGSAFAVSKPKYDSDDQSSMMSEPGSPQDLDMSSGDDDDAMSDLPTYGSHSQTPRLASPLLGEPQTNQSWQTPEYDPRILTPMASSTRKALTSSPTPFTSTAKHHMRYRHPQEIFSSSPNRLELPRLRIEDGAATPPSAAEATGSQLSMLSVNDMDIEPGPDVPTISINTASHTPLASSSRSLLEFDSGDELSDHFPDDDLLTRRHHHPQQPVLVRKQRQRSGALSAGDSPASSAAVPSMMVRPATVVGADSRRGLSIGFRAECEKCRMRVPGHMNHFLP